LSGRCGLSDAKRSPAIALWEFASIVDGVQCADAIAKGAPIDALLTGTTHPGKYVVLVAGDTASVVVATEIVAGTGVDPIDTRFLADVAPQVADAVTSDDERSANSGVSIGVVETSTVSSGVDAADAAVKAATVTLSALRMADGIGGKAYVVVDGDLGDVEAAVEAACERAGAQLVGSVVISQLAEELREDLAASARFLKRVRSHRTAPS
jgi:microcompartment protein CcmL/EutN